MFLSLCEPQRVVARRDCGYPERYGAVTVRGDSYDPAEFIVWKHRGDG
jgi:hypothetical protein